jgi:hypothetical protein
VIGTLKYNTWNLTFDFATQTYSIILNGTTLDSNVAFCGGNAQTCSGVPVSAYGDGFFDTFPGTVPNDIGYMDNYSVSSRPIPAALPLFATGLGGMGLLGWRRKRKNAAAIAAA